MKEKKKDSIRETGGTRHKILTIVGVILSVVLLPVLCVNVWLLVQGYVGEGIPNIGGFYPLIVQSGSMEPTIRTGDLILNRKAEMEEVQEGDIVSYFEGDYIVTHRVKEIRTDSNGTLSLVCQGDANNTADETPVTAENLVGKYLYRIPGLGDVAMFMQSTKGLVVCVLCPLALLILYDMLRRRSFEKAEQAEAQKLREEIERLKAEKEKEQK